MFVLVLATLLAVASSQCQLAGNTYTRVDAATGGTVSTTYGGWVSDWLPSFRNENHEVNAYTIWTQAADYRWDATDVSSDSPNCRLQAQYNLEFSSDCSEVTFTALSDKCRERHAFYHGFTFELYERPTDATCFDAGDLATTRLQEAVDSPILSNEPSTYVFGLDNFAILSAGPEAVIFQRWRYSTPAVGTTFATNVEIVDLVSYPAGLACPPVEVGSYALSALGNAGCQATLCILEDACKARWELLADAPVNGGDSYTCPIVELPEEGDNTCSPAGKQWNKHPWSCTDQEVPGGCFFCKGIAKGVQTQWCLNRESAGCNQIFESSTAMTLCNMEFECTASLSGASLFIIFVAIFAALFLH